ncbi:hypothetical protein [Trueperella pyogenes]|uniref:hypothetical protein n=1 Tax=Trueperella pyogenes TaxID=1661 RepID=UPI00324857C4
MVALAVTATAQQMATCRTVGEAPGDASWETDPSKPTRQSSILFIKSDVLLETVWHASNWDINATLVVIKHTDITSNTWRIATLS